MKLAVIGANGKTGRVFVKAALEAGHQVTAAVHRHNSLSSHPNLVIKTVDATKPADMKKLVSGQDAVISLIGHGLKTPPNVQTDAIRAIAKAMTKNQKLISLTGTGVRRPGDHITIFDRLLNEPLALVMKSMVQDGRNHLTVLEQSQVDWTVLRALKLTNRQLHNFHLLLNGPARLFVSRATVSQAILEVLNDGSYSRQAPIIGK